MAEIEPMKKFGWWSSPIGTAGRRKSEKKKVIVFKTKTDQEEYKKEIPWVFIEKTIDWQQRQRQLGIRRAEGKKFELQTRHRKRKYRK